MTISGTELVAAAGGASIAMERGDVGEDQRFDADGRGAKASAVGRRREEMRATVNLMAT